MTDNITLNDSKQFLLQAIYISSVFKIFKVFLQTRLPLFSWTVKVVLSYTLTWLTQETFRGIVQKWKKILVERGLEKVVYHLPIVIWEVLSDASRTIIALLSKIFIFHPSNMQECWDYQIKDLHWF